MGVRFMVGMLPRAFARFAWPVCLVTSLCSCAEREDSVFDPAADRTPPELLTFGVETVGQQAYATWTASEPVRATVEYGPAPDECHRHSYSGSAMYAQAGVVKLVGAQGNTTYSYRVRMRDRAGNEAAAARPDSSSFTTGTTAGTSELLLFAMIDVGWGDALFLRAPDGTETLIDAGHPQDGKRVADVLLSLLGVSDHHLDFASMTHVHEDHIGGFYGDQYNPDLFPGLLSDFSVGTFIDLRDKTVVNGPYVSLASELQRAVHSGVVGRHVMVGCGESSETQTALQWGDGVRVDVLAAGGKEFLLPDFILAEATDSVINNDSIVYRVQYGGFVMLLMGDGEFAAEQFLENRYSPDFLRASVLKLGHHGSNDANSERFLEMVDPLVGLITNAVSENPGVENPLVLSRLRERGIDYFASDRAIPNRERRLPGVRGDIVLYTDGDAFTVIAENIRYE
jgi:competence protein ComEC